MKIIEPGLILQTDKVLLRPIDEKDFDAFLDLAQDEGMWDYFTLNLANKDHLQKWMDAAFADKAAGTRRPFTIIDKVTRPGCWQQQHGKYFLS